MRRVHKNLCPATISASIMAANMWKNSLRNVESDNYKIIYEMHGARIKISVPTSGSLIFVL